VTDRAAALLRSTRAHLVRAQVLWGGAGWALAGAPVSAALAALVGLAFPSARWPLWAASSLAAIGAGAFLAWRGRVDEPKAALWLDRALDTGESFSAALACGVGARPGRFAAAASDRADAAAEAADGRPPRPAPGPLALRAALAAAACLASAALLALADTAPYRSANAPQCVAAAAPSPAAGGGSRSSGRPAPGSSALPGEGGLADLAGKALREGDLEGLGKVEPRPDALSGSRGAGGGPKEPSPDTGRLARERERLEEAARRAAAKPESGGSGGGPAEPGKSAGEGGESEGGEGGRPERPPGEGLPERPREGGQGRRSLRQGEEGGEDEGGGEGAEEGARGRPGAGDDRPGSGVGVARNWGRIEPASGGPELAIPDDPRAPLLEYLASPSPLPAPAAERVRAAARAAEAATARASLPWEYSDFLRSYYLALSRAADEADLRPGERGEGR